MQCKDIPTLPILQFLMNYKGIWCNWFEIDSGWDNQNSVRHAMQNDIPDKLIFAKMRKLIAKGLVDGCNCGCRGDFEITDKGEKYIQEHTNKSLNLT